VIFNKLKNSGKKILITATCLQTGRTVVFTKDRYSFTPVDYDVKTIINADHFRKAMMSSACAPVFFPPIKVNLKVPGDPHPHHQFADGGMREYAGVQMAIDQGATEIFAILLSAEGAESMNTQFETLIPVLERTIDIFTLDVNNNDLIIPSLLNKGLKYIEAVKNKMKNSGIPKTVIDGYFDVPGENPFENKLPIKIFIIRPASQLAGGPAGLNFVPAEMKQMLALGELTAGQFIARLDPGDITWGVG
jgi:predicted acylesterase/phospholipase RssA